MVCAIAKWRGFRKLLGLEERPFKGRVTPSFRYNAALKRLCHNLFWIYEVETEQRILAAKRRKNAALGTKWEMSKPGTGERSIATQSLKRRSSTSFTQVLIFRLRLSPSARIPISRKLRRIKIDACATN